MHLFRPTLLAAALLLPVAAHAVPMGIYKLNATTSNGGTLTGFVTFGADSNIVGESINFYVGSKAPLASYTFLTGGSLAGSNGLRTVTFSSTSINKVQLTRGTATPTRTYSNLSLTYGAPVVTATGATYDLAVGNGSAVQVFSTPLSASLSAATTFSQFLITSGSLTLDTPLVPTPVASTPEPATFLLLATGAFTLLLATGAFTLLPAVRRRRL